MVISLSSSTSFAQQFAIVPFGRASSSRAVPSPIRRTLILVHHLPALAQLLLECREELVGIVARRNQQPLLDILLAEVDRLLEHPLDIIVGQPITRLDVDRMLAAGALIARCDI